MTGAAGDSDSAVGDVTIVVPEAWKWASNQGQCTGWA